MSQMNTSHRYIYDAAPATLFRARTADPLTATADTDEVTLDALDGYWNTEGELADQTLAVIINVTDIDSGDGDETYGLAVNGTRGGGITVPEVVFGSITVTEVGQYVIPCDIATAKRLADNLAGIEIAATIAGTTPSITFHAWIGQIKK